MSNKPTYTPDQQAALDAKGKTIVSASAGSGKTTVMIKKIIDLIEKGTDIKQILAVTFTKKAAAQMKEKLSKALIKEINATTNPARKKYLKEQLAGVPNADISTIHSFCARLIRAYFYAAKVERGFRIVNGDDAEGRSLKNEALDELLEEVYDKSNADFLPLLLTYWRKKSDNTLRKLILSTYSAVRDRSDYIEYLRNSGDYTEATFDSVCEDLHSILKEKCAYYIALLKKEEEWFVEQNATPQITLCQELCGVLTEVINAKDYFSACVVTKIKFTTNSNKKTDSQEKILRSKKLAELKEKIVKIFDKELPAVKTREEELDAFLTAGKTAKLIGKAVELFSIKYDEKKSEKGVLDYSDLEHKTIELLGREEIVNAVHERYKFVFVDEYQDVNPIQEEIISKIADKELFLVGDVKQSIYGFRGSKSRFFVEKQKQFEAGAGNSLYMKRNFRSSDTVLDAVNDQFSLAMTLENSQLNYTDGSFMEKNEQYKEADGTVHKGIVNIHIMPEEKAKKEEIARGVYSVKENATTKKNKKTPNATMIKSIIKRALQTKIYDTEEKCFRYATYKDIAVLARKKQGKIADTVAELAEEGIPVVSPTTVNICQYGEIKTIIDILSLIDNAEQDVPLTSALLSPMGGLTVDELANIRLAYPNENYFRNACKAYELDKTDITAKKLAQFYERYDNLRYFACVSDAGELIVKILTDYRLESAFLAQENGSACLKRIRRFIEEAYTPEPMSMHEFLQKLRDLEYKIEYSENAGENAVKVLTMHASKGLEFPIVILDDLNASFSGGEPKEVFVEEKYGLAPRAYDTQKMKKSDTLLRRLHAQKEEMEGRADELNLYYVALTRAQYGLHMIFKKRPLLADVKYAKSFADFTDFSVWEQYVVDEETQVEKQQETEMFAFTPNEEKVEKIMEAFSWGYTHTGYENLPVKSSATALMQEEKYIQEKEEIDTDEETLHSLATGREAGIAYHAFLENFDFSLLYGTDGEKITAEKLQSLVQSQYDKMQKSGEDTTLLSVEKLVEILSNPVFYTLKDAQLYKEQQFLVSLPIATTYGMRKDMQELSQNTDGEEMIFQGAIDLLAVGEKEVRIIDYKYSVKDQKSIKAHYKPQLDLYKQATARILGIDPKNIHSSIVNIYRGYQVDMD